MSKQKTIRGKAPVTLVEANHVLTREAKAARALSNLLESARLDQERHQEQIDTWLKRASSDPARAFEWSKDAFVSAARLEIAKTIQVYVEKVSAPRDEYTARTPEQVLQVIEEEFAAEVLRNAKYPEHSTSPTSNYMSQCKTAARAEALEQVQNHLKRIAE